MDALEIVTRTSIWVSVAAWAAVVAVRLRRRGPTAARWLWTLGCAAYVVHAVAAFHRFYDWSHAQAVVETARRTFETTGFETGSGLWLNYLVGLVWLTDATFWWIAGDARYRQRPRGLVAAIDAFLAFMIFNGTVVFGRGPVRWFGAVVFAGLTALYLAGHRGARGVAGS